MLQITRPPSPHLRGVTLTEERKAMLKEASKKAGFFVGVVGLLSGFVWLASR